MNVMFHIATGLGAAVLLTDTHRIKADASYRVIIPTAIMGFITGIIAHGALDYIPHCYPIPSKLDILLGMASIALLLYLGKGRFKWILLASLIGCIFPDLVDLLPAMLNKALDIGLPIYDKVFPWHWKTYSGSIYSGVCDVSFVNHSLVLVTVFLMIWVRRRDLRNMLNFIK